jgi:ATP-binding cassette subfamily E protein 1
MDHLLDRKLGKLSGGELQRFAILMILIQNVNVYVFDEPTSYLDVK